MPTKAAPATKPQLPPQQQIDAALRSIETDLRDLARCLTQAKAAVGTERAAGVLRRLGNLESCMQEHRARVRSMATQKGLAPQHQTKLAAARTKVEGEMRKIREAQRALEVDKPGAAEHSVEDAVSSDGGGEAQEVPVAPEQTEVKIMAEQLVRTSEDGDLESEFICKICLVNVVGCNPKLTRCSHLFCGDCLDKWFAAQPTTQTWAGRAQSAGVPCPVCKEPLRADTDLHPVNRDSQGGGAMLWHMLSSTKVVCSNHSRCSREGRCDWVGDYESFQHHIRQCTNEPLCPPCAAPVKEPVAAHEDELVPKLTGAASDSDGTTISKEASEDFDARVVTDVSSGDEVDGSPAAATAADGAVEAAEAEEGHAAAAAAEAPSLAEAASPGAATAALPALAAPAAEAPSLASLIAQLVELKAANPDLITKDAVPPTTSQAATVEEASPPSPLCAAYPATSPAVALQPAPTPAPAPSKKTKAAKSRTPANARQDAHAAAAMAAKQQALQASQWQAAWAAQAASAQHARLAYAGQVAQWQMATARAAAQAQAAQAAHMQAAWSAAGYGGHQHRAGHSLSAAYGHLL